VSIAAWVFEAGSVEQAAQERGLTAKTTALQLFFRGLNLMGHKGPQAIESAVTATRRHFGPGATHQYLRPEIHKLYDRVVASYLKKRAS
jgi:hypothetical protein